MHIAVLSVLFSMLFQTKMDMTSFGNPGWRASVNEVDPKARTATVTTGDRTCKSRLYNLAQYSILADSHRKFLCISVIVENHLLLAYGLFEINTSIQLFKHYNHKFYTATYL